VVDEDFCNPYRLRKGKQLLGNFYKIVVTSMLVLLVYPIFLKPAQANPIAAPTCKDIPSCGVAGIVITTEVIGGVLYYVIKTGAGAVQRVRSKQPTPLKSQANQSGEDYVGKVVPIGIVRDRATCEEIARRFSQERGGVWEVVYSNAGISTPEGSDGSIPSQQGYFCQVEKQS
jgi:hypothetical protein